MAALALPRQEVVRELSVADRAAPALPRVAQERVLVVWQESEEAGALLQALVGSQALAAQRQQAQAVVAVAALQPHLPTWRMSPPTPTAPERSFSLWEPTLARRLD